MPIWRSLSAHYNNCQIPDFKALTHEERCGVLDLPSVRTHQTQLHVTPSEEGAMRPLFTCNWPPLEGINRVADSKECLNWWAWIPHKDYVN